MAECLPDSQGTHGMIHVLRDIVNGPIDADKLDYLQRDGHHCGVPYANCIDRHRFLASLTVDNSGSTPKLSMTAKGSACAEALVAARYWMFNQVYWGHTVRSLTSMLRASLCQSFQSKKTVEEVLLNELDVYAGTDETVFADITERAASALMCCLKGHKPYKRIVVLTKQSENDGEAYNHLIDCRGQGRIPRASWGEYKECVLRGLIELLDTKVEPHEILI